ncbi:MAG: efflux RND transporter periplasmic adaptor subunit [Anaerolineae bacterium]
MRRRTVYVILGLVAIAAVGGVILWRSGVLRGSQEEPYRSAVVERGSIVVAVNATGRIKPAARVNLSFDTPGRVAEVWVEEGDHVEKGEPLARLVTDQLELQVEQAQAALSAAESRLAQLRAGSRPGEIAQAEANVQAAEEQANAAAANRNQLIDGPTDAQIASAEAQVAQARTSVEIAQDTYDLTDEDEETRKEHANYDLYVAKQELAAAEARLEDVLAGPGSDEIRAARANVEAALAQRDAAQAQLEQLLAGPTEEDIAEAEAQVAQARVGLELAEYALSGATLTAPFAGVVTELNLTVGEMPPAREAPVVLLDNSTFHITVSVDELDVPLLEEGQSVEIGIEALPEVDVTGTVESISPVADPDGEALQSAVVGYDVVMTLDPTEAPLRADMTANATIIVEELSDVLTIPTWVVRIDRDTGGTYVQRRAGDQFERVDVELGARHEGAVQVINGLSAGDEVVRLEESTSFGFGPP